MSEIDWEKVSAPVEPPASPAASSDQDAPPASTSGPRPVATPTLPVGPRWRYAPDAAPVDTTAPQPTLPLPSASPPLPPVPPPREAPVPPGPPSSPTPSPRRQGWFALLAALIAIALIGGGFAVAKVTQSDSKSPSAAPTTSAAPGVTAPPVVNGNNTDEPIASVAAALSPSVVQIETRNGLGSGFVYDTDGHVMTAAHVVDGEGGSVDVRLADGSVRKGTVVGADDATDVAVISIDGSGVKPATLATGVQLEVGQTAVAVGSPFGLDQTVTAGIVSAIDRPEQTLSGAIGMIQTDAPINPGNSGGPLADKQGRVIGINDQIESESGTNSGVGFAIPIDIAKAVADKITSGQPVEFAFLGVSTESSQQSGLGDGATVVDVQQGSAADRAGIVQGDEITAVDGAPVRNPVELGARIRAHNPGDQVKITIKHSDGNEETVAVTLGSTKK